MRPRLLLRCEDCHAEMRATESMMRQVRDESPVFHDGCEVGRGFGIWRVFVLAFDRGSTQP